MEDEKIPIIKPKLLLENLLEESRNYVLTQKNIEYKELFGVSDGKNLGSFLERNFKKFLLQKYEFDIGNLSHGIDFPELNVDIKITNINHAQSSCPFTSARQKIFGLGYSLLVFTYEKIDDFLNRTSKLDFKNIVFIAKERTADNRVTNELQKILNNNGKKEEIKQFLLDNSIVVDYIESEELSCEIINKELICGILTLTTANQWRVNYKKAIENKDNLDGIFEVFKI